MKIKENNGYLYKKRKMIYVVKCSQEDCIYLKVNNGYGKKSSKSIKNWNLSWCSNFATNLRKLSWNS